MAGVTEPAPTTHPGIGRIERVPLREVWRHEAHNLTVWLEENIDVLSDVLDFQLVSVEREHSAGAFSADLVGEDAAARTVVIENQLERSNHDHLGKLITYVAFLDARAAVWIVSEPRPEHVRAISWLNDSSPADFYLLKIEGIRIGNSAPAPLLTLIVGPSAETRELGEVKKVRAERHQVYRRFWTDLLERARAASSLHRAVSPGDYPWIGAGAGKTGLTFNYSITRHAATTELYIDRGRDTEDENKAIFDELESHRLEIETSFGKELQWQRLDGKRACRIAERIVGGYLDEDRWTEIQDEMVAAMTRLERALKPYIGRLKI